MRVFTHTQGRTGTGWLAKFFEANTDWPSFHEHLRPEDYVIQTPDVGIMRMANSGDGYNNFVRDWWHRKADNIPKNYVETAHMLCKAGMHKNRDLLGDHKIVHLYRPLEEVISSMARRLDYMSHGNHWLWYLDPNYPNNIVDPDPFYDFGHIGLCAWYWHEIEARCPEDAITVQVNDLNNEDNAREFLLNFGIEKEDPIIPEITNASMIYDMPIEIDDIIDEVVRLGYN